MVDKNSQRLEDNELWREACDVAEYMYGKLHEFPEEEKWVSEIKMRQSSNDLMFSIACAVGNESPSHVEFDWGIANKNANGLKSVYKFSTKQKFIELEPEIMVRLDNLIAKIHEKAVKSSAATAEKNEEDFKKWRKIIAAKQKATEDL